MLRRDPVFHSEKFLQTRGQFLQKITLLQSDEYFICGCWLDKLSWINSPLNSLRIRMTSECPDINRTRISSKWV